jgi:branched-chain amino acid transport system permease protein
MMNWFARQATRLGLVAATVAVLGVAWQFLLEPWPDPEQARLCRLTLPALSDEGAVIDVQRVSRAAKPFAIRIDYQADGIGHTVRCGFSGAALDPLKSELVALVKDGEALSPVKLHLLRRYWLERPEVALPLDPGPGSSVRPGITVPDGSAYLLQQLANGFAPTAVLSLLAAAYALIYGLIGRINLAFGDLAVVGAMSAVTGVALSTTLGVEGLLAGVLLAGAVAVATTILHGLVSQRIVFAPLAFGRGQTLLIATIALSIVLQEYMRIHAGSEMRWIPPILGIPLPFAADTGFTATITVMQLLVTVLGGFLALGLVLFLDSSDFGRRWRAVADDARMAALLGVSARRVMTQSFLIASLLAGFAGFITAMQYGGASPSGGTVLGLKALAAAIVGGVGSVGGAMLGGVAIGLMQAVWVAYLPMEQADAAVLCLLVAVLILRPGGLFGFGEEGPRPV